MRKSFLKGASLFLASVLTIGMCSGYRVEAKTKFSVPKKVTLSYDKQVNGVYTNIIPINGTSNSDSYKIQDNFKSFKSSNKKVIGSKPGKDFYPVFSSYTPGAKAGVGVTLKKTGTTKITFKFKYKKKTYTRKTTVKVVKYTNPFKKIVLNGEDRTSEYRTKVGSQEKTYTKTISITPNKNWKVKSAYIHKTYNGTPQKVKKPSSFSLKEGYDGFVIMENKKNKLTETVAFTYWDPAPLDDEDL